MLWNSNSCDIMHIPMITIERGTGKNILTGNVEFDGWHISSSEELRDIRDTVIDIVERSGKGSTVVMVDVDSIKERRMDIALLKGLRTRKIDIWLATYIRNSDDLFDAFYMNIDSLLVPYHGTASDAALREMNSVSDSTIPLIFTNGLDALSRSGNASLYDLLKNVTKIGFSSIAVMDLSGTYDEKMWSELFSDFDRIIPIIPKSDDAIKSLENIGFVDIITL